MDLSDLDSLRELRELKELVLKVYLILQKLTNESAAFWNRGIVAVRRIRRILSSLQNGQSLHLGRRNPAGIIQIPRGPAGNTSP